MIPDPPGSASSPFARTLSILRALLNVGPVCAVVKNMLKSTVQFENSGRSGGRMKSNTPFSVLMLEGRKVFKV